MFLLKTSAFFITLRLIVYPRLSTCSRRALTKRRKRWGHPYQYRPRGDLLNRLCGELGWTKERVLAQIQQEREYLLKDGEAQDRSIGTGR